MKQKIAEEAARLLTEAGTVDYGWARRKATQRLGVSRERELPDMMMIETAFRNYQKLFRPQDISCVAVQHEAAAEMMSWLEPFSPHLAGPLVRGISAPRADILIYVYADSPKELVFTLMEKQLVWESDDLLLDNQQPVQLFFVPHAGQQFRLLLLPLSSLRQPPVDEVTGRRDAGLNLKQLQNLVGNRPGDGVPATTPL
ncbi:hypothetical protein BOW35_02125 [Solemya velum gill symbiont]|uniref:hypothetical protein n=1 Tax=Solemya velum gill symbiont TaxID=2340 RepID=UPI0009989561|nr:hypothetical protein [Solemya velum gill symbiont]OOZ23489.1 hypothetical protein BOW30_02615 [Solemya velum gill symbiont]OOZ25575.1 hypothetical protein BOW31_02205 [Solemya velum gill symbiont]OOZ32768.1 hypothetical protein BOW34_02125 [Solemya velum gill symbiont]OOZ34996.1 hypothetical protein BOW35_02125 [Solemya velum gill symbiont]